MIDAQRIDAKKVERLRQLASSVRSRDLQVVHSANLGHIGGEMSAIDILVTLYFAVPARCASITARRRDEHE
jgi:transketolase